MEEQDPLTLFYAFLDQALRLHASDLHLEPQDSGALVRARVDGKLRILSPHLDLTQFLSLTSRIKLLAGMDIGQRRLPQDGSFSLVREQTRVNIRVSSLPSIQGEKLALRLLREQKWTRFDQLGMNRSIHEQFSRLLEDRGLILVCGPTGSGKTTTLYAALHHLRSPDRNVITLEDPVEYPLEGVVQVQINPQAGLHYSTALRAALRQDPDVLLIGEIRDSDSAAMALRAAMTGHLVLSTMHTPVPSQAPLRLVELGVPPYLVANGLRAVLAQELVPLPCQDCTGTSCPHCEGTGMRGRTGRFALMEVDERMRTMIYAQDAPQQLEKYAKEQNLWWQS